MSMFGKPFHAVFCTIRLLFTVSLLTVMSASHANGSIPLDQKLATISQTHPEFAGLTQLAPHQYQLIIAQSHHPFLQTLEQTTLTANQVKQHLNPNLIHQIEALYGNHLFSTSASSKNRFTLKQVSYPFYELHNWHQHLVDDIFSHPAVTATDIDEQNNQIVILINQLQAADSLHSRLEEYAIPKTAYRLEYDTNSDNTMLTQQQQGATIQSGLSVFRAMTDNQFGVCTIGFVAYLDHQPGIVTNSHCSDTFGKLDSSVFYHGHPNTTLTKIGTSELESTAIKNDRYYSDATFIPFDADETSIKATPFKSYSTKALPIFRATPHQLMAGKVVFKTGQTSGTTSGRIERTCINTRPKHAKHILLCQMEVVTQDGMPFSLPGDSGAAIYGTPITDNEHTYTPLLGLLWGGNQQGISHFSSIQIVLSDLYPIQLHLTHHQNPH